MLWTYRSYVVGDSDVVSEWIAAHSATEYEGLLAKINVQMTYLQATRVWPDPYFHPLTHQEGVGAVRFKWNKTLYRPLGFFGPGGNFQFTFLYFATEKGNK